MSLDGKLKRVLLVFLGVIMSLAQSSYGRTRLRNAVCQMRHRSSQCVICDRNSKPTVVNSNRPASIPFHLSVDEEVTQVRLAQATEAEAIENEIAAEDTEAEPDENTESNLREELPVKSADSIQVREASSTPKAEESSTNDEEIVTDAVDEAIVTEPDVAGVMSDNQEDTSVTDSDIEEPNSGDEDELDDPSVESETSDSDTESNVDELLEAAGDSSSIGPAEIDELTAENEAKKDSNGNDEETRVYISEEDPADETAADDIAIDDESTDSEEGNHVIVILPGEEVDDGEEVLNDTVETPIGEGVSTDSSGSTDESNDEVDGELATETSEETDITSTAQVDSEAEAVETDIETDESLSANPVLDNEIVIKKVTSYVFKIDNARIHVQSEGDISEEDILNLLESAIVELTQRSVE